MRGGRQRGGLFINSSGESRAAGGGGRSTRTPAGVALGPGAVTRNWILYNRNNCTSSSSDTEDGETAKSAAMENAHAGSLLSFGLLGHLSVLNRSDISDYLTKDHEPTSIAMLIGLAASNIGSADPLVSRTLYIHLPSLLFPTTSNGTSLSYATYQAGMQGGSGSGSGSALAHVVSPLVQTAALTGLGLLHCGTGHRLMVEFLIAELIMGPSSSLAFSNLAPPSDCGRHSEAREAVALAAGWALGMVLLGMGKSKGKGTGKQPSVAGRPAQQENHDHAHGGDSGSSSGSSSGTSTAPLSDLRLEDRLQHCIEGGRRDSLQESKLFTANTPLRAESHSSLAASRARSLSQQGGGGVGGGDDPSSKSSRSLETDFININITAPGAIMALTLMYLKSNNKGRAVNAGH